MREWTCITPVYNYTIGQVVVMKWYEPESNLCLPMNSARTVPLLHFFPLWTHEERPELPPCLQRMCATADEFAPHEGWKDFLEQSGITVHSKSAGSYLFFAQFFNESNVVESGVGKTGGLHMSFNTKRNQRRCQLCVERGTLGQNLQNTLRGTKAGILLYVTNVDVALFSKYATLHADTSLSLSFSLLLLTYAETVSLVRKHIYEHRVHPYGHQEYKARMWDYTHVPYYKRYVLGRNHVVDMSSIAHEAAQKWILAEKHVHPQLWKHQVVDINELMKDTTDCCVRILVNGEPVWIRTNINQVPLLEPFFPCILVNNQLISCTNR